MADKLKCLKHDMDDYLSTTRKFTPELKNKIRHSIEELNESKVTRKRKFLIPNVLTAALSVIFIVSMVWIISNSYGVGTNANKGENNEPTIGANDNEEEENPSRDNEEDKAPDKSDEGHSDQFALASSEIGDNKEETLAKYGEPTETYFNDELDIETYSYNLQDEPQVMLNIGFKDDKIVTLSLFYLGEHEGEDQVDKEGYIWDYGEPNTITEVSCYHTATCEELIYLGDNVEKVVRFSWDGSLEFVQIKQLDVYNKHGVSVNFLHAKISEGVNRFWYAFNGGNIEEHSTFELNGFPYEYFGEDLNSVYKMREYLNKVYTKETIDNMFKKYHWIEHEGKLARPQAGFGSNLNWSRATLAVSYEDGRIVVVAEVPLGDGEETVEQQINFELVEGKGWLLATEVR